MSKTPRTDALENSNATRVGWATCYVEILGFARQLETELAEARQQLETERMRLAACSTAALGYFTDCLPEYRSASLDDVLQLRQQLAERDALVERMRDLLEDHNSESANWCKEVGLILALTPSTALAAHDVEVRRKVLEEAADILEFDEFHDSAKGYAETELRRMAKGE